MSLPAAGLGPVEREIGVADQLLDAVAVARADRDADAGADEQALVAIEERPLQRADQSEAELLELVAALDVGHDDGEFVAAEPAGGHLVGDHRLEAARDLLEEVVAGDMAEAVVDRLEPVEIDQQHRALAAARLRLLQGARRDCRSAGAGWAGRSARRGGPYGRCGRPPGGRRSRPSRRRDSR